MSEKSVSLPLSMGEVVEAVCVKVRDSFRKDCNFNADLACDWFKARIVISIEHSDIGRLVVTNKELEEKIGVDPAAGDEIYLLEKEIEIEKAAPNQVRMETGQGIPVAVTDKNGKTDIKRVQYKRPGSFLAET